MASGIITKRLIRIFSFEWKKKYIIGVKLIKLGFLFF